MTLFSVRAAESNYLPLIVNQSMPPRHFLARLRAKLQGRAVDAAHRETADRRSSDAAAVSR